MTVAELLAEFETNRAATIGGGGLRTGAVRAASARRAAWSAARHVFHQIAVAHVLGHAKDILTGNDSRALGGT
jgi:hypothetical protein